MIHYTVPVLSKWNSEYQLLSEYRACFEADPAGECFGRVLIYTPCILLIHLCGERWQICTIQFVNKDFCEGLVRNFVGDRIFYVIAGICIWFISWLVIATAPKILLPPIKFLIQL